MYTMKWVWPLAQETPVVMAVETCLKRNPDTPWAFLREFLFASIKSVYPSFYFTFCYFFYMDTSSSSWREVAFFKGFGRQQTSIIDILKSSGQESVFSFCHCSWQAVYHKNYFPYPLFCSEQMDPLPPGEKSFLFTFSFGTSIYSEEWGMIRISPVS